MSDSVLRRAAARTAIVLALASGPLVGGAGPALADTSQTTAQAATVQLLGQPALSTGQVVASNDGTSQTKTGSATPALSVFGAQTVLSAGALFQDAVAANNGTSAACAGVVGPNGAVQIGPRQGCLVSGTPTGVVVNLGLAVLRADAITASCTANANGATSGTVSLVNAKITDPTGAVTLLAVPANPTPNTPLGVPGILDIVLNEQSSASPGQLSVTALHLTLLGGLNSETQVPLGTVTCGPNARTDPRPPDDVGGPARGRGRAPGRSDGLLVPPPTALIDPLPCLNRSRPLGPSPALRV